MSKPEILNEWVTLYEGRCEDVLPTLAKGSVDAVVTDPPYEIGFMGKSWDSSGIAFNPATWSKVMWAMKPGGYLAAMGGTRTYHRLTCAIEDAGFEIRDCLMWVYGTGFPKGHGCLKPAWEPIVIARKPGEKVLPFGIDECRVGTTVESWPKTRAYSRHDTGNAIKVAAQPTGDAPAGRYPANVLHDGSDEVMEAFAAFGEKTSGKAAAGGHKRNAGTTGEIYGGGKGLFPSAGNAGQLYGDSGTSARFFYCAKPTKSERGNGNSHPTVKPIALIRWLVRLITPPEGTVLDPFGGSGTTPIAGPEEWRKVIAIEKEASYCAIIRRRVREADGRAPGTLFAEAGKQEASLFD